MLDDCHFHVANSYEQFRRICNTRMVATYKVNDEFLDGGITGTEYEKEFDELEEYIYQVKEKGRLFEDIDVMIE